MAGRGEIQIVYEDDCLIVIDKPSGLLTMSTGKEGEVTAYSILTDYVRHNGPRRRQADRIFIVHRLDRYTSGLLVFAKDPETKYALQDNWNDVVLERTYVAVVEGTPRRSEGTIASWLREDSATHTVYSVRAVSASSAMSRDRTKRHVAATQGTVHQHRTTTQGTTVREERNTQ